MFTYRCLIRQLSHTPKKLPLAANDELALPKTVVLNEGMSKSNRPRLADAPIRLATLDDVGGFTLSPQRQARLLDEQFECTFAWTNTDGAPVAVTQAFIVKEGAFWMCSEQSRVRVKAILRDPRSAVVVSSLGTSMGRSKTLSFKGHSEVVPDRETILWLLWELARKYDPDNEAAQEAHVAAADTPGRVVIKFVPLKTTNNFDGDQIRQRD